MCTLLVYGSNRVQSRTITSPQDYIQVGPIVTHPITSNNKDFSSILSIEKFEKYNARGQNVKDYKKKTSKNSM